MLKLRRQLRGFTLIELMVTIAVIAILSAIAAPSMVALMNSNRLSSTAGELTAAVQLARAEAIRRNSPVRLCRSTDGTTCSDGADWGGWAVVGNNNLDDDEDVVRGGLFPGNVQLAGPEGGITFNSAGLTPSAQVLTVCIPTERPADNQRVITVSVAGHVASQRVNGGGTCS
ncbi:GspH/FimT family pseudopilin [Pseudoxanthomonas sp.]|uniref:GspH/FimT family pseudopilin n=1 Tax=Pseudoxanthomonas sp. TaxID=1871049 RepID=UPI002E0F41E4|nr:GspH/FimT family pseudopilin [Pseudoxanthomonas sp.]